MLEETDLAVPSKLLPYLILDRSVAKNLGVCRLLITVIRGVG